MDVGVLSLQGDVGENLDALYDAFKHLDLDRYEATIVNKPEDLEDIAGLVIPGGESTVIGNLSMQTGIMRRIHDRAKAGMPILGICAGMILLSNAVQDKVVGRTDQPLLSLLDVQMERNSFGRQRDSFEIDLSVPACGSDSFPGIFIRAPSITRIGPEVEVLSKMGDAIVAVRQGNVIGTTFHPELADDPSFFAYFMQQVVQNTRI